MVYGEGTTQYLPRTIVDFRKEVLCLQAVNYLYWHHKEVRRLAVAACSGADTNGIDYHNIFDFDTANGAAPSWVP